MPATEAVDPADVAAELAACVREAGMLALGMFQSPIKSWTKAKSSPVSDADIAVDRLLHGRLTAWRSDFGWLSEESADDNARLAARFVWIVDPIDGTRAYLAGLPDWAVSAALVENGRPVAACLYAPVTDEMFIASTHNGATRNGVAMAVAQGNVLADTRIAGPKGLLERIAAFAPPFAIEPRVHSLALRFARVAQGTIDVAIAGADSHDWDLAAADLLVHEAGGLLTSFAGRAVIYNQLVPRHGMLVACGLDRHATMIELLGDERLAP